MTTRALARRYGPAAVLVLVVLLAGALLLVPAAAPAPSVSSTSSSATAAAAARAPAPTVVDIPAIGVHSTLIRTGIAADGTAQVPDVAHPEQAAWAAFTPSPGEVGPSVLLGHVNGGGHPGVFSRLHELHQGDEVLVDREDGSRVRFLVDRVDLVVKTAFPTAQVYGDVDRPELRVLTCGGELDTTAHRYLGQVIVYAHLAA